MAIQPTTQRQTAHIAGLVLIALATIALIVFYVIIAGVITAGSAHVTLGTLTVAGLMGGSGTWLVRS
jgi:hypothetical protein